MSKVQFMFSLCTNCTLHMCPKVQFMFSFCINCTFPYMSKALFMHSLCTNCTFPYMSKVQFMCSLCTNCTFHSHVFHLVMMWVLCLHLMWLECIEDIEWIEDILWALSISKPTSLLGDDVHVGQHHPSGATEGNAAWNGRSRSSWSWTAGCWSGEEACFSWQLWRVSQSRLAWFM